MKILLHFNFYSFNYQRKISKFPGSNPTMGLKIFFLIFALIPKHLSLSWNSKHILLQNVLDWVWFESFIYKTKFRIAISIQFLTLASAMCSWLHKNSNVIRQVMVTCKSHHLLMTLAICLWLQVTSLTTATTTSWSNVTWRLHEIVTLLGKWWLLLITWLQVTWHHYFCKSRAHGQCRYQYWFWKSKLVNFDILKG